jgi:hypothetical protein
LTSDTRAARALALGGGLRGLVGVAGGGHAFFGDRLLGLDRGRTLALGCYRCRFLAARFRRGGGLLEQGRELVALCADLRELGPGRLDLLSQLVREPVELDARSVDDLLRLGGRGDELAPVARVEVGAQLRELPLVAEAQLLHLGVRVERRRGRRGVLAPRVLLPMQALRRDAHQPTKPFTLCLMRTTPGRVPMRRRRYM